MRIPGNKVQKKINKEEIMQAETGQPDAPDQKKRKWQNIWCLGAALSLIGAFIMLLRCLDLYPIAKEEPSVAEISYIGDFTRYNYVLYRDLYNAANGTFLTFENLYGETDGGDQELALSDSMISQGNDILKGQDAENIEDANIDNMEEKVMQRHIRKLLSVFLAAANLKASSLMGLRLRTVFLPMRCLSTAESSTKPEKRICSQRPTLNRAPLTLEIKLTNVFLSVDLV